MDPITVCTIITTLATVWQTYRAAKYKDAAKTLIDGVEAAVVSNNPKHEIAIRAAGKVAGSVIDALLDEKKLRKRKATAAKAATKLGETRR